MEVSNKIFKFYINRRRPKPFFETHLLSEQCRYIRPNGEHCTRNVVMGIPFCPQHLAIQEHLKIKKSTIPHSGKGLFAFDSSRGNNAIVFRGTPQRGDLITMYDGEIIDRHTLEARYRDYTAPYAIRINPDRFEDAAKIRGVGAYVQHSDDNNRINCKLARRGDRIAIIAVKNILNGKELFANYGNEYEFNEPTHYSTRN